MGEQLISRHNTQSTMAAIHPTTAETRLPVDEYVSRFVDRGEKPICEYLDGELLPKPMGIKQHSLVQMNIAFAIRTLWFQQFNPLPELTTRLREKQFYVPDIAVEDKAKPIAGRYPGPDEPVFLCVEILSPPDRIGKLFGKCEEYHRWGVPHCWIVDPERQRAWEYAPDDLEPRRVEQQLTAGPVTLVLPEVFAGLPQCTR